MTRDTWQTEFARQLNQKLGIMPEQVRFCWKQYFNQRYSVEGAIADLEQKHQLYPMLGILPNISNIIPITLDPKTISVLGNIAD